MWCQPNRQKDNHLWTYQRPKAVTTYFEDSRKGMFTKTPVIQK